VQHQHHAGSEKYASYDNPQNRKADLPHERGDKANQTSHKANSLLNNEWENCS